MKPPRKSVSTASFLIELAPCMQPRKNKFGDWGLLLGVQPNGNTATVILDGHAAIGMKGDLNLLAMTG